MREKGVIAGLKLYLMADGEFFFILVCESNADSLCTLPPSFPPSLSLDPHHSKLGDTRPRLFERIIRFGDSPQVGVIIM